MADRQTKQFLNDRVKERMRPACAMKEKGGIAILYICLQGFRR